MSNDERELLYDLIKDQQSQIMALRKELKWQQGVARENLRLYREEKGRTHAKQG